MLNNKTRKKDLPSQHNDRGRVLGKGKKRIFSKRKRGTLNGK